MEKGNSVGLRRGEGGSNPGGGRKLILQVVTKAEQHSLLCGSSSSLLYTDTSSKGYFHYVAVTFLFEVPRQSSSHTIRMSILTPTLSVGLKTLSASSVGQFGGLSASDTKY